MVKKGKSQMKAHVFSTSDPVSIICFFAPFEHACDTTHFQEWAAMWVLPFFVKGALAPTLNNFMSAATNITSANSFVRSTESLRQKKLLGFYHGVVNSLLKKFADDRATAKMDFAILCYVEPVSMTLLQYGDVL